MPGLLRCGHPEPRLSANVGFCCVAINWIPLPVAPAYGGRFVLLDPP